MSRRRQGFPSETNVKRGQRVVRGDKELLEKLGRNDPCPCGSAKPFQALLHEVRLLSMEAIEPTTGETELQRQESGVAEQPGCSRVVSDSRL
jgi:hypothetical protein